MDADDIPFDPEEDPSLDPNEDRRRLIRAMLEDPKNLLIVLQELKPTWIVTEGNKYPAEEGEFGISVGGVPLLYYKYSEPSPCLEDKTDLKFREIHKREFGETIRRPGSVQTPPTEEDFDEAYEGSWNNP